MKRVERRNALEAQLSREPAPHIHLTNPTLTPVQVTSPHVSTPAGEEDDVDEMDEVRSVDTPRSRSPSRGRRPLSRSVPTSAPVPARTSPGQGSSSFHPPWSKHNVNNAPSTMVKVSSERTHPLRKVVRSHSRSHSIRTETDSEDEDDQESTRETRRGDSDGESGSIHSMTRGSGSGGGEVEAEVEEQEPSVPPHSAKTSPKSRGHHHHHNHHHHSHGHPHWTAAAATTTPAGASRTSPVVEGTVADSGLADSDAVSTAPSSGLTAVDSSQSSPASPAHLSLSPSLGKVLGKRRSPSAMEDRVGRDIVKRKVGSGGDAQQAPARVEA